MTDQQTISVIGYPPFSPCRSTTKSKAMERPCNPPGARSEVGDKRFPLAIQWIVVRPSRAVDLDEAGRAAKVRGEPFRPFLPSDPAASP